uniref:Uncharacterized protein n=1 Tax=Anguilla anguilla TaxID=7936 RepID=A0A0E9VHM1_ANGAN
MNTRFIAEVHIFSEVLLVFIQCRIRVSRFVTWATILQRQCKDISLVFTAGLPIASQRLTSDLKAKSNCVHWLGSVQCVKLYRQVALDQGV